MNNKTTLPAFYAIVTLFTGLDMAIVIAMVWFGLQTTGSTFLVGVTLCIATVVPYALEQYLSRHRVVQMSMRRLLYIRLVVFASIVALSFTQAAALPIGFLGIAFLVGVTDYFTISTLESQNTRLVLAGHTTSDTSARLMQTAIQIGAFGGALLGGVIVDRFAVNATLQIIGIAAIVSLAAIALVAATPAQAGQAAPAPRLPSASLGPQLYLLIVVLSMIGFHIGAFNSLVPIVFQKLNGWNATLFGTASGLAGLGAFCAAVLPRVRLGSYGAVALIIAADVAMVYFTHEGVMMAAAGVLGFCINSLRIELRRQLIEAAPDEHTADVIAARSSLFYLLVSGAAPMLLTLFTTQALLGMEGARVLMVASAVLLGSAVLLRTLWPAPRPVIVAK